jgi:hypothetical protein
MVGTDLALMIADIKRVSQGFSGLQNCMYVGKLLNKSFLNIDLMHQISNFSKMVFCGSWNI